VEKGGEERGMSWSFVGWSGDLWDGGKLGGEYTGFLDMWGTWFFAACGGSLTIVWEQTLVVKFAEFGTRLSMNVQINVRLTTHTPLPPATCMWLFLVSASVRRVCCFRREILQPDLLGDVARVEREELREGGNERVESGDCHKSTPPDHPPCPLSCPSPSSLTTHHFLPKPLHEVPPLSIV